MILSLIQSNLLINIISSHNDFDSCVSILATILWTALGHNSLRIRSKIMSLRLTPVWYFRVSGYRVVWTTTLRPSTRSTRRLLRRSRRRPSHPCSTSTSKSHSGEVRPVLCYFKNVHVEPVSALALECVC